MGEIEWAMWANEQAVISATVLLIGGIVGVAGVFHNWQFAAFAIAASLLLLLLEYPRSKRKKGSTVERKFQAVLVPVINRLGPVTKNYYARSIIHLVLCVPCCFILPTVLGGMCLMITAIIYLVAAIKGEEWIAVTRNTDQSAGITARHVAEPPSKPPPRGPHTAKPGADEDQSHNRAQHLETNQI